MKSHLAHLSCAAVALISLFFVAAEPLAAQALRATDSVSVAPGMRLPATRTGASRAIVDSNDVKAAAALTFSELMQARGASVNVLMSGGRLVDGGQFLIRGPSTVLTDGAPLLIVDGMRMSERQDDPGSTSSRVDDIAIDDIAKVEVLRGPSAAALYGAGASSGVIVVTTKRGHAGRFSGHARAVSELRQDAGKYVDRYRRDAVGFPGRSCSLAISADHFCVPGALHQWNPLSQAGVFQSGLGALASLDVAGGARGGELRASTTVRKANGISRGDGLSQLTARLNATQRFGRWVELTGQLGYYKNNTLGSLAGEVINGVSYYSVGVTPADSFRHWADYQLSSPAIDGHLYHLTTGADLAVRPTQWLTLRVATTRDHVDEAAERVIRYPSLATDSRFVEDALGDASFTQRSVSWNTHRSERATAEVNLPLPAASRVEAGFIVGNEREWRRRTQSAGRPLIMIDPFDRGYSYQYANTATFAFGHATFADRLALTAGVRNEMETGVQREYNAYPTASASLQLPLKVFGAEPRVRASFGESAQRFGAAIPASLADATVFQTPISPEPERMRETEAGVDLDWGARGGFAFTAYRRTITNATYAKPFRYPNESTVLDIASSGLEFDVHAAIVQRTSARWDVRAVVSTNANRVTTPQVQSVSRGAGLLTDYPVGVVQRPPLTYHDANGDGVIGLSEIAYASAVERVGGSTPTLSMALHSELQLGRRLTVRGIVDRRNGAWGQSGYVSTVCGIPEDSCQAHQDPTSSLADQAAGYWNVSQGLAPAFDASFTRLREVSVRWAIGSRSTNPLAPELRVVLAGRDLATWTRWPGPDPEISSSARSAITRNDIGAVPLPRRISLGVEVGY